MKLDAEQVADLTERLLATLKTRPALHVIVKSDSDAAFGEQYDRSRVLGIEGGYYPASRRLLLIASAIRNPAHLHTLLRHELFGHYALNTFRAADKLALLQTIQASRSEPTLAVIWHGVESDYPGESPLIHAEEVYSFIAERSVNRRSSLVESLRFTLRAGLRSLNIGQPYNLADLEHFTRKVAAGIRDGTRRQLNFPGTDHDHFRVQGS